MHAKDSDAVARYLLTETDARDLEITARGLEDAFLSLTGDHRRASRPTEEPAMSTTADRTRPPAGSRRSAAST